MSAVSPHGGEQQAGKEEQEGEEDMEEKLARVLGEKVEDMMEALKETSEEA